VAELPPRQQCHPLHEGDSFDTRLFSDGALPSKPQYGDIRMVEVADGTVKPLDR